MEEPLRISYHIGQEGAGREPLRPERAYFYWKRPGSEVAVHTASFDRAQLAAEIQKLERDGRAVPPEFREALKKLD